MPTIRPVYLSLALAILASCHVPTSSIEMLDGRYSLSLVNGLVLPYDDGPVPPRPGIDSTCRILLVAGRLLIHGDARTFDLSYDLEESCSRRFLGTSGSTGTLKRAQSHLTFMGDAGDGRTDTRTGRLRGRTIELDDRFYRFVFVRL